MAPAASSSTSPRGSASSPAASKQQKKNGASAAAAAASPPAQQSGSSQNGGPAKRPSTRRPTGSKVTAPGPGPLEDGKGGGKKSQNHKQLPSAGSSTPASASSSASAAAAASAVVTAAPNGNIQPSNGTQKAKGTVSAARKTAHGDLPFVPILQGSATTLPVVFTKDADYFCVASASHVKIHSRTTGEVVSTLSSLDDEACSGHARDFVHTADITGLIISPFNPLQLITSSLDGTVKVWDYLDAVLLKNIDLGYPITHLAAHSTLPQTLLVAIKKPRNTQSGKKPDAFSFTGRANSIVYSISLRGQAASSPGGGVPARRPRELLRIGKTRDAAALAFSPDGQWLVAIGNRKVQIARTKALRDGFTKFVSDETLVSLAFHPRDPLFATGDARGQIRIWYCLDERYIQQSLQSGAEKRAPSTLLHWHTHAVRSLAFTPNGAYLASGGEEAVMVLWQLSSQQREYIPRLGAPINSISVADGMDGREQEFALSLADGSIMFIGALNLKPTRTFARAKIDSSRQLLSPARLSKIPSPLALEPVTGQIVMVASHPSTLQFFDATNDRIVAEVEVAPSNRVSRPEEAVLEPSRVERIAFSSRPVDGDVGPAEWMATIDSRNGGDLTSESALKIWRFTPSVGRYVMNTRIDQPHEGGITSLAFAPLPSAQDGDALLLVTTGQDRKIRSWRLQSHVARGGRPETYWVARSVFGYRNTVPRQATWSADGSLLAVAQGPFVTLWEPTTNALEVALSCPELKQAEHLHFVGRAGRHLAVASGKSLIMWDLVHGAVKWRKTFETAIQRTVPVNGGSALAVIRQSANNGISQSRPTAFIEVLSPASREALASYQTPFGVREACCLVSREPDRQTRATSKASSTRAVLPELLAVTDRFDVIHIGASSSSDAAVSSKTAQSLRGVSIKRRTLFDDLFGADFDGVTEGSEPLDAQRSTTGPNSTAIKDIFALFDAAAIGFALLAVL